MAEKESKKNLRNIALSMLVKTLSEGEFSNAASEAAFEGQALNGTEKAFVQRLYLGVLERLIYLDFIINKFSSVNTAKMKPVVLNILRLGIYQLIFMNSVPDFAAINEAGKLAKKRGFGSLAPFVNGVLRAVQKNICKDGASNASEIEKQMPENVRVSVPKWMYEMTVSAYGKENADAFFSGTLTGKPGVTARLNLVKGDAEEIQKAITDEGCALKKIGSSEDMFPCFNMAHFENLTELKSFKKGLFIIQDLSSVRAAQAGCKSLEKIGVEPKLIIDVCAAPGGKSMCVAERFRDARIISRDLSEEKINLIRDNIRRLGISNIETQVWDATAIDETLIGTADMVVADLPCSGLGVIGKKPDIKFRVKEKDVKALSALQRQILSQVCQYVKPGGILLYSTCTITPLENTETAQWICGEMCTENGLKFEKVCEEQLLPSDGSDGFFISTFIRRA